MLVVVGTLLVAHEQAVLVVHKGGLRAGGGNAVVRKEPVLVPCARRRYKDDWEMGGWLCHTAHGGDRGVTIELKGAGCETVQAMCEVGGCMGAGAKPAFHTWLDHWSRGPSPISQLSSGEPQMLCAGSQYSPVVSASTRSCGWKDTCLV